MILNALIRWCLRDARFYHFWRPQSGAVGGIVFGAVTAFILLVLNAIRHAP